MILQHGSGGPNGGHELWAKTFNEMGIASFLVDSFSGRGLTSTSTNQALLGRLNMVLDGYRAFDVLANHPRIDPARIAVMGFSLRWPVHALCEPKAIPADVESAHRLCGLPSLYAPCNTTFIGDTDLLSRAHTGSSMGLPTITWVVARPRPISSALARPDATLY